MTDSPYDVVRRHMAAFDGGSMADIVADYGRHATLILPHEIHQGREEIHSFFAAQRAVAEPPRLESVVHPARGEVVIADWTIGAGTSAPLVGRDVFIVTGGKIECQAVYFDPGPAP